MRQGVLNVGGGYEVRERKHDVGEKLASGAEGWGAKGPLTPDRRIK